MPTTTINSVSDLTTWVSTGIPAGDLGGATYRGEMNNTGEYNLGASTLSFTGHTNGSIILTTAAGQSFSDQVGNVLNYNAANGVAITSSVAFNQMIDVNDSNVTISKLQLKSTDPFGRPIKIELGSSNTVLEKCIVVNSNSSIGTQLYNGTIRNCLFVAQVGGAADIVELFQHATVAFCTFVTPSNLSAGALAVFVQSSQDITLENCAFFGCVAVDSGGSATYTNCMTDVTSSLPVGVSGGKTYASQFQNPSSDWRIKVNADLFNAGVADITNGATDIVGTSRPQGGGWDIGAFEFVVPSIVPIPIWAEVVVNW